MMTDASEHPDRSRSTDRRDADDRRESPEGDEREFAEESDALWQLVLGPAVWALHFLACYAAAAVWCAKAPGTDLQPLRLGIAVGTALALALIAWAGWRAWRAWDYLDDRDDTHGGADNESRHEFLGHAGFLLCGVSFIGVLFTALPAVLLETCR